MSLDPTPYSAFLASANAHPDFEEIRAAAKFVLDNPSESELLTFFYTYLPSKKPGKLNGLFILADISRGQSKAHDTVALDIICTFLRTVLRDALSAQIL